MEGLDFNQRIKYDFLFLQMGEDGRQSISIMLCLQPHCEVCVITEAAKHKHKDNVTNGNEAT